jgi:hypothetical protein
MKEKKVKKQKLNTESEIDEQESNQVQEVSDLKVDSHDADTPKKKKVKVKKEKKVKAPKEKKVKDQKKKKEKKLKNREKLTNKYFKKFSGRADESFADLMKEDFKNAMKRAEILSSIQKTDYERPVIITIPDAYNKGGKVLYHLDVNKDGTQTLVYNQSLITILFFGKDSLFYYQANIDHRNGHIGYDVSGEFNYFDVTHIETQLKYDDPDKPKYLTLDIEIGLIDGTIKPFHLRNHRIHDDYELPNLLTETEYEVLTLIKSRVRDSRLL